MENGNSFTNDEMNLVYQNLVILNLKRAIASLEENNPIIIDYLNKKARIQKLEVSFGQDSNEQKTVLRKKLDILNLKRAITSLEENNLIVIDYLNKKAELEKMTNNDSKEIVDSEKPTR